MHRRIFVPLVRNAALPPLSLIMATAIPHSSTASSRFQTCWIATRANALTPSRMSCTAVCDCQNGMGRDV